LLHAEYLENVAAEYGGVAGPRPAVELLDDVATDGIDVADFQFAQRQAVGQFMQRKQSADTDGISFAHKIGFGGHIMLIGYVADQLLQYVFEGDDSLGDAVLIDDDGQVNLASLKLAEEARDGGQFGDEEHFAFDLEQFDVAGADDVDLRAGQTGGDGDGSPSGVFSSMNRSFPAARCR